MPLAVKLYESNGSTLVKALPTTRAEIGVDRKNSIRRTARFNVGAADLAALKVPGRKIKITDDAIQTFEGSVATASPDSLAGESMLAVYCLDKSEKLRAARWADDKTYEDTTATETANLLTVATSVTSTLTAGDQIQSQAKVYSKKLYATVLGIEKEVTPTSESGDILAGTYSADYSEPGLTQLRLEVLLDLKISENLQNFTATTNGTATLSKSSDGIAWSAWAAGTARYLKASITKSAGPATLGLTVTTNTTYSAANVLADDAASWRPGPADLDRQIVLDVGSAQTANRLQLKLGVNDLDHRARYKIKIERSTDASTWTEITTVNSAGRYREVVFDAVSIRYIRLTLLSRYDTPFAVRWVSLTNCTVDPAKKVYLSDIIQDIASGEGETLFRITSTRTIVKAVTFERGETKWDSILKLCADHGWEAYYAGDGYLVARPIDVDPWVSDMPTYSANLRFDAEYSFAEVFNQILAENGDPKNPLISTQTNGNAWSGTSTVHMGTRSSPIRKFSLADSQLKLDQAALAELERSNRQTHTARLTHIADGKYPGSAREAGDVIQASDAQIGISGMYVLESFRLTDNGKEFDFEGEVAEL